MKPLPLLWISLCTALAITSCGLFKASKPKDPNEESKTAPPKLVGRIASIPADKRFVLIQSYGKWNIETGTILTTRGTEERTANLLVTGESLGQFAAADLKSGTLKIGDAVYSRHIPPPAEPSQAPPTASPASNSVPELPEDQPLPKF